MKLNGWPRRGLISVLLMLIFQAPAWAGNADDRPSDQQRIAYWQNILNDKPHHREQIAAGWKYRLEPQGCEPYAVNAPDTDPPHADLICHTWLWMKAPDLEWGHLTLAGLWVKGADGWREWAPK